MPIKVQCTCGKAFAAKDELAGKTVKCPGCQKPLKIPGGAPAAAKASGKPAAAAKSAAGKPAAGKPAAGAAGGAKPPAVKAVAAPAAAPPTTDSLFDEIGLQAAAANTRPCPGCTEPMPIDAVVCIKCGYNSNLGRRMQTVKVGGEGGGAGHGAIVEDLMNRAADTIDGDAEEEVKKTKSGMPWWFFLIVLILLVGFAAWMLLVWGKEKEKEGEGGKGKGSFYGPAEPALYVRVMSRHSVTAS